MEGIEPVLSNGTQTFGLSGGTELTGNGLLARGWDNNPLFGVSPRAGAMSSGVEPLLMLPVPEVSSFDSGLDVNFLLNQNAAVLGSNLELSSSTVRSNELLNVTTQNQPLVGELHGDLLTDGGILTAEIAQPNPQFYSGVFTVGDTGEVSIDFLFDGGAYRGEVAIFSLEGMEQFALGSKEFIEEAASRALSGSELGHVVISDPKEGARFNGKLGEPRNWNKGEYQGLKTFTMKPTAEFAVMLVPNGKVQDVIDNPAIGGAKRPLFSLATANPHDAFHVGQIADVTGDGSIFVMEDLRVDGWTDLDYNDIIFQVGGATGSAVPIDEVIDLGKDWRKTPEWGRMRDQLKPPNIAPESLQFSTQTFYALDEKIDVLGGSVRDANGVGDLNRVEFLLQHNGGNPMDIAHAISFHEDSFGRGTFDYELTGLAPGRYTLSAIAYDQADAASNQFSQSFTILSARSTEGFSDRVKYAIERAVNLNSYTSDELESTQQWVVSVQAGQSADTLATSIGAQNLGATGHIPNTFTWQFSQGSDPGVVAGQLSSTTGLEFFYPLIPIEPPPSSSTIAPNLTTIPSWNDFQLDVTGQGVVIGIVDNGLQFTHPALQSNYRSDLSRDFNEIVNGSYDTDPTPLPDQMHGTAMGLMAAGNGAGVTGVAPDASLAGLRLTADTVFDSQIGDALSYLNQDIDIYNNSWGDSYWLDLPQSEFELETGANRGRDGLGSIFVFEAGDNGLSQLNANYNPFANSRHTIAVAAIDANGGHALESEPGAPILVSAYSNLTGFEGNTGSTDSAAAAVSGVTALMLEANPTLTWRDVQHILIQTAQKNDLSDSDWTINGAGYHINHKYGFGAVDVAAAVEAATNWTPLEPEVVAREKHTFTQGQLIPESASSGGIEDTITIKEDINVEWVEVMFDATHDFQGDLRIVLTSPDGTQSVLAESHTELSEESHGWLFTSARHWGESSLGDWKLQVFDQEDNDLTGIWDSWQLNVFGTENPQTVTIEANQPNAVEGGADGQFTVERVGGTKGDLEVFYSVAGTATNGTDYQPLSGSIWIPDGESTATIDLKTIDDSLREWNETVTLSLQADDIYNVGGDSSATVNIAENENSLVAIAAHDSDAGESDNPGQFLVTRVGGNLNEDLIVNYTVAGTATNGTDYEPLSGSVTIAAGETEATIDVNPIDDTEVEWYETVEVNLDSGAYDLGTNNNATVTIAENEQPIVDLTPPEETDLSEGGEPGEFLVSRFGGNQAAPLEVNYNLAGTATNGNQNDPWSGDYPHLSGIVTIAANETTATIPIIPRLDDQVEGDETVEVNLTANNTYQLGNNTSGAVSIADVEVPGPHIANPLDQTHDYTEDTPLPLTPIEITDPDGVTTVTITLDNPDAGQLVSDDVVSDSNGVWQTSINDSVSNVNDLLSRLEFQPAENFNGDLTAEVTVTDDVSAPLTGTINLNGIPVNDVPTVEPAKFFGAVENNPFAITHESLGIATQAEDVDQDTLSFRIDSVDSGQLTKNGQPIVLGDTISPDDQLIWTPDNFGDQIPAFKVSAWDGNAASVSVQVTFEVIKQSELEWQESWPPPSGGPGPGVIYKAKDVVFDSQGNVYMTGWRHHPTDLDSPLPGYKAFLLKYDSVGALQWAEFLGDTGYDDSMGIAVDSQDQVYVTGTTKGILGDNNNNFGGADAWLAKYDGSGAQADRQWVRQLGTVADDSASGITIDSQDNIYISGTTEGNLGGINAGGKDAFIAKYDTQGNELWTDPKQFGTAADDSSSGVAVDGTGSIYVSGTTEGNLGSINAGGEDAFVAKYNNSGNWQFTQLGSNANDSASGVAVDGAGNVLISGTTDGSLPNKTNAGGEDAFVAKYDSSLDQQWVEQFGTEVNDSATDVDVNRETGDIYLAVNSQGQLGDDPGTAPTWLVGYNRNGDQDLTKRLQAGNTVEGIAIEGAVNGNSNELQVALTGDYSSQVWVERHDVTRLYVNNQLELTLPVSLTYTEDQPLGLESIVVADTDLDDVISISLQLDNPTAGSLTTATQGTAQSTFDSDTGLWQVSGLLDDVNALLADLQFVPTANFNGNLTIDVKATDNLPDPNTGVVTPLTGTIDLIGTPVDDVPIVTDLDQTLTYIEDTPLKLKPIEVDDPDDQTTVTLTLDPSMGKLESGDDGISSNPNGVWQTTGSAGKVNIDLANLKFQPVANFNGNVTISAEVAHPTDPATGTINLIGTAVNDAPTLTSVPTLPGATENQPLTIKYDSLANAANEADVEGDAIEFQIDSLLSGTLTKDGSSITPGVTTLAKGEQLVWTPSTAGSSVPAFTVVANDGNAVSSPPVQVNINVAKETIVSISPTDPNASEAGDSGLFTINRTGGDISQQLTVNYSIGGTATNGTDYDPLTGIVNIAPGQTTATIAVNPFADDVREGNETVILDLTASSEYGIDTPSATVTIEDEVSLWTQQLGTANSDKANAVVVDSEGNVYMTGRTSGNLDGNNEGIYDAWVAKYDSEGNEVWKRQLGSSEYDEANGIAVDNAGNVYLTGITDGSIDPQSGVSDRDAWVAMYNSAGDRKLIQQLPSPNSDYANGIAVDNAGNIYLTGGTDGDFGGASEGNRDAWIAKYDATTQQWQKRQLGTSEYDEASGIAVDNAGNIYITGTTAGDLDGNNLGSTDAWIAKYDSNLDRQWQEQLGTSAADEATGIAINSAGRIFITGNTQGNFKSAGSHQGNSDAWIAEYDSNGEQLQKEQLGTNRLDNATSIAADSAGNVYITGRTFGDLDDTNQGNSDAWVAKYDSNFNLLWQQQRGTAGEDAANGVFADDLGFVYIAGETVGDLGGTNQGGSDAWVEKLVE